MALTGHMAVSCREPAAPSAGPRRGPCRAPDIFLTWVAAGTRRRTPSAPRCRTCSPAGGSTWGRGGTEQETSLCGVGRERTTQEVGEALRIIGKAWEKEELEHHGELLDIGPHPILPRPKQTPHPPLFLACSKTETLTQAAELGIGAQVMGFAGPEAIAGMRQAYDAAIAARDDARRVGIRGQRFSAQSIGHWYGGAGDPDEAVVEGGDEATRMREAAEQAVARLHEHDIPARPTATATFNADHAYGTADDALSAAFPDLGGTVTDAVEARRVLAASPAHRKPPSAVGAVVDRPIPGAPTAPGPYEIPVRVYYPASHCPVAPVRGEGPRAGAVVVPVAYRLAAEARRARRRTRRPRHRRGQQRRRATPCSTRPRTPPPTGRTPPAASRPPRTCADLAAVPRPGR